MATNGVFIALDLSESERAKLTRIARGWRQVDLAALAGATVDDVISLEKSRWFSPKRKRKLLSALGLINDNEHE